MLQRKRQLKKEKVKSRIKIMILGTFFLFLVFLILEYIYLNFSFGREVYLNPTAKNKISVTSIVEKELDKANLSFSFVDSNSDGSLSVKLKDDGVVILSSKKDIRSQISSLQLVLSRLTIEGKKLKILDLRFDNPVISF